ncbi:MAG: ClbS/DfsB family four-helix bundle protein [Ktedonobacteraceae bacterium]|nr:ClbS/DfsB family four-helix bundle protein [Ktedonobacteraceae bacterium]
MDTPMTKEKFLSILHSERANWEALLAKIDTSRMTQPGFAGEWSLKDVIAHVAYYEEWTAAVIEELMRGETKTLDSGEPEDIDVELRNARFFKEHQHSSLPEVLAYSQKSFQHLLTVVQSLPEEELLSSSPSFKALLPVYWPDEPLWKTIAGDSYEHYHQHIPDIQAWAS